MFYRKSPKIYLFDLAGYSTGKFDSQLLRFLEGSREAAQIGQRIHADQSRCLFIHGLKTRMKRLSFYLCWHTMKALKGNQDTPNTGPVSVCLSFTLQTKMNSPGSTWKQRISGFLSRPPCRLYWLPRTKKKNLSIILCTNERQKISGCQMTTQKGCSP